MTETFEQAVNQIRVL